MSIIKECAQPIKNTEIQNISKNTLLSLYKSMLKIRLTEEAVADLIAAGKIQTPCHLYIGQEAVASGVCTNLKKDDFVFSTHRSHGHYIAKGGDLKKLIAEIFCKIDGCCKGRGGSMHIADSKNGLPGSSAIVSGTIPLAVGSALGFKLKNTNNVSVAFFGDGATTEGVLYESLNFASLKKLPVVFVCENNFYSTHLHISKIQSIPELTKIGELFKMPVFKVDGYNAVEVHKASRQAIELARKGAGPSFIEAVTYRWRGHVGPNWDLDKPIRKKEEVAFWVNNCAIKKIEDFLLKNAILSEKKKNKIVKDVKEEIDDAIDFAKKSKHPKNLDFEGIFAK